MAYDTENDPIVELINNEVGSQRIINICKYKAINDNATNPSEVHRNAKIRGYYRTYETAIKGLAWLVEEHEGKELRKELQHWAMILLRDGKRKRFLSFARDINSAGDAYIDFSKAIIEAFKKLPK